VYGEDNLYVLGDLGSQGRTKISFTGTGSPIKEGPLSLVLFDSPFTSVSTVSRGHPFLVSLVVHYLAVQKAKRILGFGEGQVVFQLLISKSGWIM
jgi:hypothetical protein